MTKRQKAEEQEKDFAMTDDGVGSGGEGSALQLVVFDLEGQRYGLPLDSVDRVLPMVAVSSLPKATGTARADGARGARQESRG